MDPKRDHNFDNHPRNDLESNRNRIGHVLQGATEA